LGVSRTVRNRRATRAHAIAWRDELAQRALGGATIRHRLASLASLFEYLCEKNAVTHNPVKGVERPRAETGEGKTPALGDHQARALLDAPRDDSIKSKRDRAMLSTRLFHALRRQELWTLKVRDFRHPRKGVPHLKVSGKGGKTRYLPLHPGTNGLINDYLAAVGHGTDENGALFRPIRNNRTGRLERAITPRMRCASPPPPTRSTTRPMSPRCRSGSATPTSAPRGSTITAAPGPRTARRSRWRIDMSLRPR
jgi:site-specific recombinase XerC